MIFSGLFRSRGLVSKSQQALALLCLCSGATLSCVSQSNSEAFSERLRTYPSKVDARFAKSNRFAFSELRVGQWATYRWNAAQGSDLYSIKVVGPGDLPWSYWIEEELENASGKSLAKSLWILDPSRAASAAQNPIFAPTLSDLGKAVRVITKVDGDDAKEDAEVSGSDRQGVLPLLQSRPSFLSQVQPGKVRKRAVKAGTFAGCFQSEVRLSRWKGLENPKAFSGCFDPQVPFWGVVDAVDPEGRVWELYAFGFSGAKSDF